MGKLCRAGFVWESAKVQGPFRGLPQPENKLALRRLLDTIQFLAKSTPTSLKCTIEKMA